VRRRRWLAVARRGGGHGGGFLIGQREEGWPETEGFSSSFVVSSCYLHNIKHETSCLPRLLRGKWTHTWVCTWLILYSWS
jgi:hypothetical protein